LDFHRRYTNNRHIIFLPISFFFFSQLTWRISVKISFSVIVSWNDVFWCEWHIPNTLHWNLFAFNNCLYYTSQIVNKKNYKQQTYDIPLNVNNIVQFTRIFISLQNSRNLIVFTISHHRCRWTNYFQYWIHRSQQIWVQKNQFYIIKFDIKINLYILSK